MNKATPEPVEGRGPGAWLLFIYHVPPEPSSARSAIWRETKRLGALALQHGVCLLPETEANASACARLAERVGEYRGEASVLETTSPSQDWHERTIARFNGARDEEYREVIDEAERFREEVARERRKGKFTFAELEDEESSLERLRKYFAQVDARDCFGAAERTHAAAEVEECARELEKFTQEIYERQDTPVGEVTDGAERQGNSLREPPAAEPRQ